MSSSSVLIALRQARNRARQLDLGSTATYKVIGLALGLVANLGAIALLTQKFGVNEYAAYALIASFLFFLPFADVGLGAGVVNAISDVRSGKLSPLIGARVVARSRTLLSAIGLVLISLSVLSLSSGKLSFLLGSLGNFSAAVLASSVTIAVFAAALPLGVGSRILQGMGMVSLNAKLGLINPVCTVALFLVLHFLQAEVQWFLLIPCMSYFVVNGITYLVATRILNLPKTSLLTACKKGGTQAYPLARTAFPFFVITIGMTIGFQSHRLIIAHLGTPEAVASYSLVAQFAGPVSAVLTTAGQNLWSRYRGTKSVDRQARKFFGDVVLFAGLGVGSAIVLAISVFAASHFLTGGGLSVSYGLIASAALYVLVVAIHQPGAMFLTDPKGLTIQAIMVVVVSACSLTGIIVTYSFLDIAAPYLIYAITVALLQMIPTWLIVSKRLT